jgi:hypothetical protein
VVFDTEAALQRLHVVGLNQSTAKQIVHLVNSWVDNNGAEETVKRVKAIKVNLLRHYAGLPPILGMSSWIKYRSEGPKGPFGTLFRIAKSDFRTAWNAIMIYSSLVYHDSELWVTDQQWSDLLDAIISPALSSSDIAHGLAIVHKSPLNLFLRVSSETGDPLVDYQVSERKRAPLPDALKTGAEPDTLIDSLAVLMDRTLWSIENWDILSGTLTGLEKYVVPTLELNWIDELASGPILAERPLMGNISLIQEAGFKLRFAANPHRLYQAALGPLGRKLLQGLRMIDNDCTFDHEKGFRLIQGWLRDGLPAVSMDLSNATDRAPLDFQLEFLSKCHVQTRWLQFLKSLCRGDWRVNPTKHDRSKERKIQWTVGAPLGLYPTFAMFALWHHAVVQAAFAECGWDYSKVLPYVILGDDLVIMDYEVASVVRDWFRRWGMVVSEHKSLSSPTTAEFASRIITSSVIVRGFKWKGVIGDESFVSFAQQMGPRSLLMMRPRHKRVLAYIGDLPEPYGLGWNPYGIPMEERLTRTIELVWERDERFRTFSSRSQRVNRMLYASKDVDNIRKIRDQLADPASFSPEEATSDQEAEAVLRAMLPGLESLGSAVWPNLPTVALARGVPEEIKDWYESMLKRQSILEDRVSASTLVILERKIRAVLRASL